MLNNRVLIVVNSVYQLFTAVHIRRTILEDRDVDLLLTDVYKRQIMYFPDGWFKKDCGKNHFGKARGI